MKLFYTTILFILCVFSHDSISDQCKLTTEHVGNGYFIDSALKQRALYVQQANIAIHQGDQASYNKARARISLINNEIRKLDIEKAIQDLTLVKSAKRMTRIWSNHLGRDIEIILMPNCKFNIVHSKDYQLKEISESVVIMKFKQAVSR